MEQKKKTAKKTRVLVTGAAGFLGRYIIDELTKRRCDIVAIVRPGTDTDALQTRNVDCVFGDIRDRQVLAEAMTDVDVVVHAAATFWGSWEDFDAVNVQSTRNLLELASERKIQRFVYISSVSVYDHTHATEGQIFTEASPYQTEQLVFYAQSKIAAENVVQEFSEAVPSVILRPGALYGVGGPIYPAQLGLPLGRNRYGLIGNGKSTLPLCHVQSVAEAVWLAIRKKPAVGSAYNLVEDSTLTRLDYLRRLKNAAHPDLSIVRIPYPLLRLASFGFQILFGLLGKKAPLRPLYLKTASTSLYFSTDKIKKELGWKPAVDFEQSLDELFAWYRQQRTPKRDFPMRKGRVEIPANDTVNVGIVGCGGISGVHLAILKKIKNARVVALADPSEEARTALAAKFGVNQTYADIEEMLAAESIEVVHVLSPAQFHAEQAVTAIQKGCHVLVEKPMALTTSAAEKIAQAASQKKVKVCVGHNHLYDAAMIEARKIIAEGALGQVTYVESWYGVGLSSDGGNRALSYDARNAWFYQLPGGLYQDFISHPISLLLDVMEDAAVSQTAAKYFRVVPHMVTDELRVMVENDARIGMLSVSLAVSPRYQFVKIYGTQGTLTVDLLNKYTFLDAAGGAIPKTINRNLTNLKYGMKLMTTGIKNLARFSVGKLSLFEGTERMIRLFYRSVLLNEPTPVSPEEGVQSMRLMDEIWRQIEQPAHPERSSNGKLKAQAQAAKAVTS